ncbi:hypothetical protein [Pseudomonas sp. NPDC089534]|uniref:hypothetical protein n=1 Tax=Pseudomonas sp. NPDC089534 TaxID=3364468 RepID=UPI00380EF8EB
MDTAADVYVVFIKHVGALVEHGIRKFENRWLIGREGLNDRFIEVIDRLKSSSAKIAIANAFSQLEPEIEDALVEELKFVIANINFTDDSVEFEHPEYSSGVEEEDEEKHDADVASAAKTGKDSLEDILGKWLPKWLKNRLKILNEILSIVFKI